MRQLATIQKVTNVRRHPNADSLDLCNILGWQVVIKRNEYKDGDLCVYVEIDSILPDRPEFAFLKDKHFRIKTVRLRKEISQGICFPLSILNPKTEVTGLGEKDGFFSIGEDVTDNLGITKYEPYVPAHLAGTVKGNFPSFIPKTDETRIQSVPEVLIRHKGKPFYVTEKIDGSSATFYWHEGVFGVCSRNLDLKETAENAFWQAARKYQIEEKLKIYGRGVAMQAELAGLGIQGNKLKLPDVQLFAFNIFDIAQYKFLNFNDFRDYCLMGGIQTVPIIDNSYTLPNTVDELVKYVSTKSVVNRDVWAEGFVFRPLVEERDEELGRLSFKCISPMFLLEYGE